VSDVEKQIAEGVAKLADTRCLYDAREITYEEAVRMTAEVRDAMRKLAAGDAPPPNPRDVVEATCTRCGHVGTFYRANLSNDDPPTVDGCWKCPVEEPGPADSLAEGCPHFKPELGYGWCCELLPEKRGCFWVGHLVGHDGEETGIRQKRAACKVRVLQAELDAVRTALECGPGESTEARVREEIGRCNRALETGLTLVQERDEALKRSRRATELAATAAEKEREAVKRAESWQSTAERLRDSRRVWTDREYAVTQERDKLRESLEKQVAQTLKWEKAYREAHELQHELRDKEERAARYKRQRDVRNAKILRQRKSCFDMARARDEALKCAEEAESLARTRLVAIQRFEGEREVLRKRVADLEARLARAVWVLPVPPGPEPPTRAEDVRAYWRTWLLGELRHEMGRDCPCAHCLKLRALAAAIETAELDPADAVLVTKAMWKALRSDAVSDVQQARKQYDAIKGQQEWLTTLRLRRVRDAEETLDFIDHVIGKRFGIPEEWMQKEKSDGEATS